MYRYSLLSNNEDKCFVDHGDQDGDGTILTGDGILLGTDRTGAEDGADLDLNSDTEPDTGAGAEEEVIDQKDDDSFEKTTDLHLKAKLIREQLEEEADLIEEDSPQLTETSKNLNHEPAQNFFE